MKHKLSVLYPYLANGLLLLWCLWWALPLPEQSDSYGAIKLIGFIVLGILFLLLGIIGLVLTYQRVMLYELAAMVVLTPLFHFLAMLTPSPLHCFVGLIPVFVLPFFSYLFISRMR